MAARGPGREPKSLARLEEWARDPDIAVFAPEAPVAAAVWAPEQVRGRGDAEIDRIAAAQRGYATREQLLGAGLRRGAIEHRLATGRLHARYRGVYLVGRPSSESLGEEMAAVLLFAGHAILSHRTAAALWELIAPASSEVTLTRVGRDRRSRPGLRVHRIEAFDRRDLRAREGLPVTSPARTILDLAAEATTHELEQAVAQAKVRRLLTDRELEHALRRAPRHKGIARVRALLAAEYDPAFTRSEAERRILELLRAAQLPLPIVNGCFLGFEVDLRWPEQRLATEIDGRQFHSHRGAFERDRRRDQVLVAAGYRVMRITWTQLVREPLAVVARITQALCAGPAAA